MGIKAQDLATLLGATCEGDGNVELEGISGIREAVAGELTFIAHHKYIDEIKTTKASCIIAPLDLACEFPCIIRVAQPRIALVKAIGVLTPQERLTESLKAGVNPRAFIGQDVVLGDNVHVGPFAIIEDDVHIGANTIVYPGTYIGPRSRIGTDCKFYPNVTIREEVIIGDRVIVHSGTVIGGDGFGYTKVEDIHYKIPQRGIVQVDDDVEIGSNVSVDRATFGKTWIKKGTKIDNLVQIAHNVIIGENCILVAEVGIAGSTELGNNVTLAGQVGVNGHIKIGDNSVVVGRGAVTKSLAGGEVYSGAPARPLKEDFRIIANINRLPELAKRLQEMEKKYEELSKLLLESNLKENQS